RPAAQGARAASDEGHHAGPGVGRRGRQLPGSGDPPRLLTGRVEFPMDAYRAVVDKRDQRAFLPKPIPEDALRRILQAGRMTGSSKNSEPNRFIVIQDRERLAAVAALGAQGRSVGRAARVVAIATTGG